MSAYKRNISVLLSMLLIVTTVLAASTGISFALNLSVCSAGYKSGPYYAKLCNAAVTGNQRQDIVNIALSQDGYREGNLAGTTAGSNNFTEYGNWYGSQAAWCAIFVSWCANQAGVSTNVISKTASPMGLAKSWYNYSSAYNVQPGDIVYVNNGGNHCGIVWKVDASYIYTVEGNTSNRVRSDVKYRRSDGKCTWSNYNASIKYVYTPAYTTSGSGTTPTVCSHTFVTGSETLHPHKEYKRCTSCGYTYYTGVNFAGKIASCNECKLLNNANMTYSITINGNGGQAAVWIQAKFGEVVSLLHSDAQRDGYTLMGWNLYRPADGKWFASGVGWSTEAQINEQGLRKNLYPADLNMKIDNSWIDNGPADANKFVFYAVWKKDNQMYSIKTDGNGGQSAVWLQVKFGGAISLNSGDAQRPGYTLAGWNLYRPSDDKWYAENYGWATQKQMNTRGLKKNLYPVNLSMIFDNSWIDNGPEDAGEFVFYAVWKKNDQTTNDDPPKEEEPPKVEEAVKPETPTNLSGSADKGQVYLTWEAGGNESNADYYTIYRSQEGGNFMPVGKTVNLIWKDETGLSAGKQYFYYIVAHKGAQQSSISSICTVYIEPEMTRDDKIAEAVKNTKITSLKAKKGKSKIVLTWKKSSSKYKVDGYIVMRTTKKGGTYKEISRTKNHKFTTSKLPKKGKKHYYMVAGYRKVNGEIIFTRVKTVTVKG